MVVAFVAFVAFGAVGAVAGCGIDTAGTLASSASSNEPAPPGDSSAPPRTGVAAPAVDAGADSAPALPVCTDGTLGFDGIDDYGTVPDDSGLDLDGDFTVEAWIKPGAQAVSTAEMDLVSHHDALDSRGWVLLLKDGRVEIVVYGDEFGKKGYSAGNAGPAYVVPDKWAHVAGTLQGDTLRVYYDGKLRDTQDLATFFGRSTYVGALRFGRASYVDDLRYVGELDDVRLSNVARYTGETAARPTAILSIDGATEASWRFDETSGSTLIDAATAKKHDGSIAPDTTQPSRRASACIKDR